MRATVALAEWLPDQSPLGAAAAQQAKNCIPSARGYLQWNDLDDATSAVSATCIGAASFRASDNTPYTFAGMPNQLSVTTGSTWTDATITGSYSLATDYQWEFVQWGNYCLATGYWSGTDTNDTQYPQKYLMGTDTKFSNLLAANDAAATEPEFRAAHIAVVRDFVVYGDTYYDGARYPSRVWWSGIGDATTITPSVTTQADYQSLYGVGWVRRIVGGEYGTVLCDRGVYRMTYVGAPIIWQFDLLHRDLGTAFSWGVASWAGTIWFIADSGFVQMGPGGEISWIGAQKVDRWFRANLLSGYEHRVSAVADPQRHCVFWAFPSLGSTDGRPDLILCYAWDVKRWSLIDISCDVLLAAISGSYSIDDAVFSAGVYNNLDALTISLDSSFWQGKGYSVAAIDTSHKLSFFDGSPLAAVFETEEAVLPSSRRAMVRHSRPLVNGGTASVEIGSRNLQGDAVTWSASSSMDATGKCDHRREGRYHRARVTTSGAYTEAIGVELDMAATGDR